MSFQRAPEEVEGIIMDSSDVSDASDASESSDTSDPSDPSDPSDSSDSSDASDASKPVTESQFSRRNGPCRTECVICHAVRR